MGSESKEPFFPNWIDHHSDHRFLLRVTQLGNIWYNTFISPFFYMSTGVVYTEDVSYKVVLLMLEAFTENV